VGVCAFSGILCGSSGFRSPTYWRRGIGRRLAQEAERILLARGFRKIVLWVLEGNTAARSFYEAMAFARMAQPGLSIWEPRSMWSAMPGIIHRIDLKEHYGTYHQTRTTKRIF
jgi:L-amino acid N-acyltransferase YncA